MNKIEGLQIKSLFKQLDYLSSEIDWKEEFLSEMDQKFIETVQDLINTNEEFKNIYDELQDKKSEIIKNNKDFKINTTDFDIKEKTKKDDKLKSLFREIVKKTHPDKIEDEYLNNLYLVANESYETDDIFSLYKICSELHIEYEMNIEEKEVLEDQIFKLEGRISFMENSYTWNWANTNDKKIKEKLVFDYLKQQMK